MFVTLGTEPPTEGMFSEFMIDRDGHGLLTRMTDVPPNNSRHPRNCARHIVGNDAGTPCSRSMKWPYQRSSGRDP